MVYIMTMLGCSALGLSIGCLITNNYKLSISFTLFAIAWFVIVRIIQEDLS